MRGVPIEYYTLARAAPQGPVLGYFCGNPVLGSVLDQWGKRYRYTGVVPRRADGSPNLRLLHPGEWVVEPGLIYALDEGNIDDPASPTASSSPTP
jgi:hypothetical protein